MDYKDAGGETDNCEPILDFDWMVANGESVWAENRGAAHDD